MGNSNGVGFDIGEKIDYINNKHWIMNDGSRKDGEKEPVVIFTFNKKLCPDKIPPAQRNIQKMRTLKHPYILSFVDSADIDDSLILVAEHCRPLENVLLEIKSKEKKEPSLIQEFLWGIRCILESLNVSYI